MKLYEYEAKEIFAKYGIPTQRGSVIGNVSELENEAIAYPAVLKAQVLVGGRGKAGGIAVVESKEQAVSEASRIFSLRIKGIPVRKILVVDSVDIEKEYYLSFTVDRSEKKIVCIASSSGGIDIEEVARTDSKKIIKTYVDPFRGFLPYHARQIAIDLGLGGDTIVQFASIATNLFRICDEYDCELAEINPLATTKKGFIAVDAKIIIDNNALFHHKSISTSQSEEYTELERMANAAGLSYVELEGTVAVIGCGAGLVMASLDAVKKFGGEPANFCDVGGGATAENMRQALDIVSRKEGVKSVFCNIFGGITRCDDVARGIVENNPAVPLSIRMMGTNEKEGIELLRKAGYAVFDNMNDAAKNAVEMAR